MLGCLRHDHQEALEAVPATGFCEDMEKVLS